MSKHIKRYRYQITVRELVYVDRTYEVMADSEEDAKNKVYLANEGECVDEQIQDTHEIVKVISSERVFS